MVDMGGDLYRHSHDRLGQPGDGHQHDLGNRDGMPLHAPAAGDGLRSGAMDRDNLGLLTLMDGPTSAED